MLSSSFCMHISTHLLGVHGKPKSLIVLRSMLHTAKFGDCDKGGSRMSTGYYLRHTYFNVAVQCVHCQTHLKALP